MAQPEAINVADFIALTKIPDPIKALPEFSGGTKNLHHWLTSVDGIVELFRPVQAANAGLFRMWVGAIRAKIVKEANDRLSSRNIPNDWQNIRAALIEIYADTRDIATLTQQIPYLKQKGRTIDEFYKETTELTSSLNQKISLDPRYANHHEAVMIFVREMTKNAFIDGLAYPLNHHVRCTAPGTIEVARGVAIEHDQSNERNRFGQQMANKNSISKAVQPVPQRTAQRNQFQGRVQNRPKFDVSNQPQQSKQYSNQASFNNAKTFGEPIRQNYSNNYQAQGNSGNFHVPAQNFQNFSGNSQNQNDVPMEIDPSTRSRFSQRSRNNQVANAELEESPIDEEPLEAQEDEEECFDETNFHLATCEDHIK